MRKMTKPRNCHRPPLHRLAGAAFILVFALIVQGPAARAEHIDPQTFVSDLGERAIKALAASAGISAPYLSQIEGGGREGTVATMKSLAQALGVTIDDLV